MNRELSKSLFQQEAGSRGYFLRGQFFLFRCHFLLNELLIMCFLCVGYCPVLHISVTVEGEEGLCLKGSRSTSALMPCPPHFRKYFLRPSCINCH